jgi:cell division transport system permease protein
MLAWLFASPPERRLLPGGRRGPTPYVIAIMTFVMMIVAAAGLALAGAAGIVERGIESRFVVQVPPGDAALRAALAQLRSAAGVTSVEPVPEAEMRDTLEQWLGPAGAADDLPVPSLIHVGLAPTADPDALARAVERAVPGARMAAHEATLRPLLRSMRALQLLAWVLVALMVLATTAAVVLAARGALDTHRSTIEVMHGIGATDIQVTHLFQRKIALDALVGSLAGGAAAAGVLLLIAGGGAAFAADLTAGPALAAADLLVLALLPVLIAMLATWVARVAVLAALRRQI